MTLRSSESFYVLVGNIRRMTQPPSAGELAAGWGAMDTLVSFGDGRVAWAYVPSPEMQVDDCTYPDPERSTWERMVYKSPLQ